MPILTFEIISTTRTNSLTSQSVTTKTLKPSIDGEALSHHYCFTGLVSDTDAKAQAKADLETGKGYGALTQG